MPLLVVTPFVWHLPMFAKWPILTISALIPLFIAFPIAFFGLNLIRNVNHITARLDEIVRTDPMTGLFNRSYFLQVVESQRKGGGMLAIVDADYFKSINDRFGHDAGDQALMHLARHLSAVFGSFGIIGRLGGEEFGIYLPSAVKAQAQLLSAQFSATLRANFVLYDGACIPVSMSLGWSIDDGTQSFAQLAKCADRALYKAKAGGRDCAFIAINIDEAVPLAA